MNTSVKYILTGILCLVIGGLATYFIIVPRWLTPPGSKVGLPPTCANILPASNASSAYAFYLTDNSNDYGLGIMHLYAPGGFRHNVAFMIDQDNNPSINPLTLLDFVVSGGCTPGNDGQSSNLSLTVNGAPKATLKFTQFTQSQGSGVFNVTLDSANNSGFPSQEMTGTAYLIGTGGS